MRRGQAQNHWFLPFRLGAEPNLEWKLGGNLGTGSCEEIGFCSQFENLSWRCCSTRTLPMPSFSATRFLK